MSFWNAVKYYVKEIRSKWCIEEHTMQSRIVDMEYKRLLCLVKQSNTLGLLLNSKKEIKEFEHMIKEFNSPTSATQKLKNLESKWTRRYRIWKLN